MSVHKEQENNITSEQEDIMAEENDEDIMTYEEEEEESGSQYSKLGKFIIQSCPGSRSTTPLPRSGVVTSRSKSAKTTVKIKDDVQRAILRLAVADDVPAVYRSAYRLHVGMVTLWVPVEPGRLHLLLLTPSDAHNPTAAIQRYVLSRFKLKEDEYTLASLLPGVTFPIPVMRFATDLNKGVVLCLPTSKLDISIHIQHLVASEMRNSRMDTVKFKSMKVSASALQTVKDLKNYIQKTRGVPTSVQELVFNGHAMQNSKLLLDYNLSSGAKLQLLLQPMRSFPILCKAFWGMSYELEVIACTTVEELIDNVLLRTLSDQHTEADVESIFGPRAMYKHLILAEYQEVVLDKQSCLNHFSISKDSCVSISASSEMRRDTHRTIQIVYESTAYNLHCGTYDTWLMVALRLHGMTGIPLDNMQLTVSDKAVDLKNTLGSFRLDGTVIRVTRKAVDSTAVSQVLNVCFPSGHIETIHCHPKQLVREIKTQLAARGVANTQLYELQYKRIYLPPTSRLCEFRIPDNATLSLTLGEFPIVGTHGSNSTRLTVQPDQTLGGVLKKLEDRIGSSPLKHCVLHAGEDLYNYDTLKVGESFLHLQSRLYVEPLPPATPVLHLVAGEDVIPLAVKSTMDSLAMQQLSALSIDTATMMDSLKWFTKWRFPEKSRNCSQTRQQQSIAASVVTRHHSFHAGNRSFLGTTTSASSSLSSSSPASDKIIMTSLHRSHSQHQARTTPNLRVNTFASRSSESVSDNGVSYFSPSPKQTPRRSSMTTSPSTVRKSPNKTLPLLNGSENRSSLPRKPAIKTSTPQKHVAYHVKPASKDSRKHAQSSAKKKLSVRFEIPAVEEEYEYEKVPLKRKDSMLRRSTTDDMFVHRSLSSSNATEHHRQSVNYPMNGLRNSQSTQMHHNRYIHNISAMQSVE